MFTSFLIEFMLLSWKRHKSDAKSCSAINISFPEKETVTLKRLCNFSWKTQLSATWYFLMQYNNLIAWLSESLLNTASSKELPGTMCFSCSYPRLPNPEVSASKLNSELFERGTKAVVGAGEATATHMQRGRSNPACFVSPAPALETQGSSLF